MRDRRAMFGATTSLVQYTGLVEDVYTHVVTTFDGAQVTLFVDGVQRAQRPSTVAIAHPSVPLLIGAGNGDPASNTFRGSIDEVGSIPRLSHRSRCSPTSAWPPVARDELVHSLDAGEGRRDHVDPRRLRARGAEDRRSRG